MEIKTVVNTFIGSDGALSSQAFTIGVLVSDAARDFSKFNDSKMMISLDGLPQGDLGILRDFR